MKTIKRIQNAIMVLKGEAVTLSFKDETLIVHAGNKSAKDIKKMAGTFFTTAHNLKR